MTNIGYSILLSNLKMTVLKAILLTLFLVLVFSLTQVGFGLILYKTELIPEPLQRHYGMSILLSYLIGYLVTIRIFWKPTFNINQSLSLHLDNFDLRLFPYLL